MNLQRPNNFCYICGSYAVGKQKESITDVVKKLYFFYFGCKLVDQDKNWAPHITCSTCRLNLLLWAKDKRKYIPFAIPMVWREPRDHIRYCYFCIVKVKGFNTKNKDAIKYPNLESTIRPISHNDLDVPNPIFNQPSFSHQSSSPEETFDNEKMDKSFMEYRVPKKFLQNELNEL